MVPQQDLLRPRGGEHDPFGLNVAKLAVDDRTDGWFHQMFPTDTHEWLWSAKSLRFPTPQADPTHHQVVI